MGGPWQQRQELETGSALGRPSQAGIRAAEPSETTHKEPKCAVHKDREINFGQTVGVTGGKERLDAKVHSANTVHFPFGSGCF